jgi:hypothetical protein
VKPPRPVTSIIIAVLLAALIHLDWHLARSTHHGGLSFGWRWHWVLAVPAFALFAWYAHRAWDKRAVRAGLGVIGLAALLAQVLEPLYELTAGATLDWTFGPERLGAFFLYCGLGVVTYVSVLWALRRRSGRQLASPLE